jgi:16S rRNA (cytidine1402-2'-O)-methyltransferase
MALFLIPTSLYDPNVSPLNMQQQELIKHVRHFIVETAKVGRQQLKALHLHTTIQNLTITAFHKHNNNTTELLQPLITGHDVGLLCDGGCPAIADPGATVVAAAQERDILVIPLIGPSAILLSLMASGFNGQNFIFHGYLPIIDTATALQNIANDVVSSRKTHIFIETPFRNQQLFSKILQNLPEHLGICVGINLLSPQQRIITKTCAQWKQLMTNLDKQPVIFLIGWIAKLTRNLS